MQLSVRSQVEKIKSIIRKCCRRTWTVGRTSEDTVPNGFNKLAKRSHGIPFRDIDFSYFLCYFCVNKNECSKVSHTAGNLKRPCCIKKKKKKKLCEADILFPRRRNRTSSCTVSGPYVAQRTTELVGQITDPAKRQTIPTLPRDAILAQNHQPKRNKHRSRRRHRRRRKVRSG